LFRCDSGAIDGDAEYGMHVAVVWDEFNRRHSKYDRSDSIDDTSSDDVILCKSEECGRM
jgi:hypothetical protein